MPGTALVLSGGGAKGAFQVAAEKYARKVKGYRWDIIAGVSVGALNATMLAMGKYERLEQIWNTISNDRVYTGKLNVWTALKLFIRRKRSIHGNRPLWEMIDRELRPDEVPPQVTLRVGAVSLQSGAYKFFTPSDPEFKRAVLASTVMPIVWPPLDISLSYKAMVDGGLRNISPLGDVLDLSPDRVVVINCNPRQLLPLDKSPRNIFDIAKRALLEIALNEILVTDLREFMRINKNVKEAASRGITLHNEKGKPYRYFDCRIIEPSAPLGDTLDFSQKVVQHSMHAGRERARDILG